jgi:hypothetical protein
VERSYKVVNRPCKLPDGTDGTVAIQEGTYVLRLHSTYDFDIVGQPAGRFRVEILEWEHAKTFEARIYRHDLAGNYRFVSGFSPAQSPEEALERAEASFPKLLEQPSPA